MSNFLNYLFKPGMITTVADLGYGSSGKGKLASYISEHANNFTFACNAFAPQAGHWVRLDDGRQFFYQTLNSCAYNWKKLEKLYIGPGATLELPALYREIQENGVPDDKLGISPMALILEDFDAAYERGEVGFNNGEKLRHEGTMKHGSTAHGCGSAAARRLLRTDTVRLARDIPELQKYLCDVPKEICERLDRGESGLLELAQGFTLSMLYERFYPHTTSRNVTVAQGMSDMFLPTKYAGPVILNARTFPIRINSNKYIGKDGKHLTHADIQAGVPHDVYQGNSGTWYPDQTETTWEEVTKNSGSKEPIFEITSVTRLARRVATFSKENVAEAIKYNDTGHGVYLSINFMNYVDASVLGARSVENVITHKVKEWIENNLGEFDINKLIIGTGAKTDDTVVVDNHNVCTYYHFNTYGES